MFSREAALRGVREESRVSPSFSPVAWPSAEQSAQGDGGLADKAAMERRKEPRVNIDREVIVTVLGAPDSPPFQAAAVEMSGCGMRILSPLPVPYQAAVRVQAGDFLLLGEVVRSESCERGHMLAVKLQHSLNMLSDLHRLNDAIRAEGLKTDRVSVEKRA
jgi:hypothetical protein